jgi:rare lipoprotein A
MKRRTMVAAVLSGILAVPWNGIAVAAASSPAGKTQKGVASFYGAKDAGKTTASGKPLDPNRMTAASPTLPLGTRAKVTNTTTGKSAQVTVTDRGPYAKGRVIDVTPKAAERLGMKHKGVAPVVVKPLSKPR